MPTNVPAWISIAVTLLSGGLIAYIARQVWSGHKLKKALKTEIEAMNGLKNCKDSMNFRRSPPSDKELVPSDVPPEGSIPTIIYELNVERLGLLRRNDLKTMVEFYSDVLRYKAIVAAIRAGEEVPEPDQKALYESVGGLEDRRQSLFGDGWINSSDATDDE